ncbi:hypothetical protein JTE90_027937 [Oedothorax gibbosus]|uniref:Complement factor H n=1 Tax=Oedothorax gibbosus TaxID=931172 RepID=A0AAV6VGI4_9ARAC|nr:hypothetical protein JTE90_027937 [Oedothorax gibbosus]
MLTGLVYVVLLTVCLPSFLLTDIVKGTFSESVYDDEADSLGYSTPADYDDYGGLVKMTTNIVEEPTTIDPGLSQLETTTDANLEASQTITSSSTLESTTGLKGGENPKNDDSCAFHRSVPHAKISKGIKPQYSEGDVVHYSCDFGYVTEVSEWTSTCIRSEDTNLLEWTTPQINCIPRSCGDPGFVVNGHRIGSLFTFPNKVSFECDEGFELKGNGIRFCKTSGSWSGTLPKCERIFCKEPVNPENGKVSYTSLEYGSELVYECHKGFILKELQTRVCSENATWSGVLPICQEAQCEPPLAPEHGTVQVVGSKSMIGSRAIFTCVGNRILVGSATSTCLEIGQWTFPAPKCREPCTVPYISHGKISKKGRYSRSREISEGTLIEDGSELLLSCEKNYEPFGTENKEEKLSCNKGEWDRFPVCEPAMCRDEPPQTPNASVRKAGFRRNHDSVVVYDCNNYFVKDKYGKVRCHYGTWRGPIPHCKDNRCDIQSLASFSIKPTTKRYYRSQESLTPYCEKGYSNVDPKSTIKCINGDWKGLDPLPCTPANCSENPPEIENGYISSKLSIHHTSEVSYACDEFFILKDSDSKIRCQFGKWVGEKPKCQDTRCYTSNLKNYGSISSDTESLSYSGDTLEIHCAVGHSSTGVRPKCVNGEWENNQELCKQDDCKSYSINNGYFTKRVLKQECKYYGTYCKRRHVFEQVGNHQVFPSGSSIYVSCNNGYNHHGKRSKNDVNTTCSQGQWKPTPVCLKTGTAYYEVTTTPNSGLAARKNVIRTSPTIVATTEKPTTTTPSARDTIPAIVGRTANCSCTYLNSDDTLAAFSGRERLNTGALIKDGCKVRFHCTPVGYYRMRGPSEITCKDCRTWHSSEYPQCDFPKTGDTILTFEGPYIELPGGEIGVFYGSNLHVTCIPQALREYPHWLSIPRTDKNTYFDRLLRDESGNYFLSQVLAITNIGQEQSGLYECAAEGYRSNSFTLKVADPVIACPIFSDDDYFVVHYDNGQSVNSKALFSCKDPKHKVFGPKILTCLPSGQWSGDPPQCLKLCPELQETEGLVIRYNDDRKTGSTANFNCILPRTLVGVSTTTCKRNGEWADAMPVCQMPSCTLEDLYSVLPEYVIHDIDSVKGDFVPYDVSIGLKCEDNKRLIGSSNTAKCKHEGKWEIGKVQCVIGCTPVEKIPDSEVVIDPEEEFYRIGQMVTFSCIPGHKLTTEIERIMCLPHGWSQKVSPNCVVIATEDFVNDQGTASTEESEHSSSEEE